MRGFTAAIASYARSSAAITPGRKPSTTMCACLASARNALRPASRFRSSERLRLLRLMARKKSATSPGAPSVRA